MSILGWCSKLNARATASLCLQGGGGENKRSSRHNVVSIEATRNGPHETVSVCGWCVYVFKCATKPLQLNHCLLVGKHASAKQSNVSHKWGVFTEYCIWYVQTRLCVRQVLCGVEIAAGERSRVWAVVTTSLEWSMIVWFSMWTMRKALLEWAIIVWLNMWLLREARLRTRNIGTRSMGRVCMIILGLFNKLHTLQNKFRWT